MSSLAQQTATRRTTPRTPSVSSGRNTAVQHYRHLRDLRGLLGKISSQEQVLRSCLEQMPRMQQRICAASLRYQHFERELRDHRQREQQLEGELQNQLYENEKQRLQEKLASCEAHLESLAHSPTSHSPLHTPKSSLPSRQQSPANSPTAVYRETPTPFPSPDLSREMARTPMST